MDRITNQVLDGLANRMSNVMGCAIQYERGSKYNGIAWKFVSNGGSRVEITGQSARELFEKAHAFISGWYAAQDKMEADTRNKD
jgi:hypothetical protein